jgi:hypothetical protein
MLIRLVQLISTDKSKTLDIADCIDKIEFSRLSGNCAWAIYVIWDDREDCIARVNWGCGPGYYSWIEYSNYRKQGKNIPYKDNIVCSVLDTLRYLFREGDISSFYQSNPCVRVAPFPL